MNNLKTIRWKQRYQNLKKANIQLAAATQIDKMSDLERAGLIQTFEYTFELGWKTLKDYLESEGIIAQTPRQVIQEAFKANLIKDGHAWIDALEKRNLLAHTYTEELSKNAEALIKKNYAIFVNDLVEFLGSKE